MDKFWTDNANELKTSLERLAPIRVLEGEVITSETLQYLNRFAGMSENVKAGIVSTLKQFK